MTISFKDRVAIVTGAGGGLGRAYALELAARGAKVVVNDLGGARDGTGTSDAAEKVVEEIKAAGGEAMAKGGSVTEYEQMVEMVAKAKEAWGGVHVLINNAGILRDKSFAKMTDADWDLIYKVHVEGAYKTTKAAWDHMKNNNFGRIIFTSSTSGIYGNFGQANYGMAKLGLYGFTRTLAIEGRKNNIFVNAIAPTGGTRMTEGLFPEGAFEKLKPELVSPLVAYLCSEECKETGSLFEVGGGWMGKVRWERSLGIGFNPDEGFTPEDVAANFEQLCSFEGAVHPKDNIEALRELMANIQKFA